MLSTLLFGLGIATALFFVSNIVFDRYIEKKYLSEEEREQRIEAYKNDLQKYVTDNGLSCDDTKKIAEWARSNKYLYLLIYKDDQLLFESGQYEEEDDPEMGENKENADDGTDNSVENDDDNTEQPGPEDESGNGSDDAGGAEGGNGSEENADNPADNESSDTSGNKYPSSGITVKTPSRDELIAEAVGRGSHPIVATDGVLLASMVDYTEYLYYDVFNIVSLFIAFASFILVMWVYFFEITKRITRLGKEVTAVADGDMHRTITAEGEDEITRLCSDVEYMRSSMLENIEKEHAALEANRELITAMSHDIRTPLTVLLGYIDIMKLNAPEGDMQQYIEASERTALRLKKMSDDMFGYFLVYGGGIEVEVQECEARTLIDQMLSGHVFLLREQGYTIDFNFESENADFLENVIVVTDPPQLMRIVENLLSNIMKYADKEKEVSIKISAETDEMTIRVSNYVALNPDMAQKNGIGLRSCMKLANAMDIRFSSEEADGVFTSVLNVPIMPMVEYKDADSEEEKRGIVKWLLSVSEKCKSFFKKAWAKLKDFILRKE
jgi:signal transduction histidine kinase